jgi:hypothetical protein
VFAFHVVENTITEIEILTEAAVVAAMPVRIMG